MEQITKKEFTRIITNNNSVFMGVTKRLATVIELENCINELNSCIVETRQAVQNGKYIVFSGGSNLDINDNKYNKYTMYKYDFKDYIVLVCACKWLDSYDNKWNDKILYYAIKK